ncbi:MAG TPA: hypothetical protein VFP84_09620 [Kofleriaceae bacterium]|nr:hypothetical protein [Kofleriaceae bacterium]
MIVVALALALGLGLATAALARPMTFRLPAETSRLKASTLAGYPLAEGECGSCHSRDYITTQPSGKGAAFWTAEVTKMVKTYGAPIPDPDQAKIVAYLAATY